MARMQELRAALVGLDGPREKLVRQSIRPWARVVLVGSSMREILPRLRTARPEVVVLFADDPAGMELRLARRIRHELPGCAVVVVSDHEDVSLLKEALRAGAVAHGVLGLPDGELDGVFRDLAARLHTRGEPAPGRTVVLLGARGGAGTTTLAMHLAAGLSMQGAGPAVLVDLALSLGDLGAFLGRPLSFAIPDLVAALEHGGSDDLERRLDLDPAGFRVLGQSGSVDEIDALDASSATALLACLAPRFRHVVVDAGAAVGEVSLAAAMQADLLLLVLTQERSAVAGARRRLAALSELGFDQTRLRLVVNRHDPRLSPGREELARRLQRPAAATVADDPASIREALAAGVPAWEPHPGSVVAADLRRLSSMVLDPDAEETQRRKRLFGLF